MYPMATVENRLYMPIPGLMGARSEAPGKRTYLRLIFRQPLEDILSMVHAILGIRARASFGGRRADSHHSLRHAPTLAQRR